MWFKLMVCIQLVFVISGFAQGGLAKIYLGRRFSGDDANFGVTKGDEMGGRKPVGGGRCNVAQF
jgi:hypothetical protein